MSRTHYRRYRPDPIVQYIDDRYRDRTDGPTINGKVGYSEEDFQFAFGISRTAFYKLRSGNLTTVGHQIVETFCDAVQLHPSEIFKSYPHGDEDLEAELASKAQAE